MGILSFIQLRVLNFKLVSAFHLPLFYILRAWTQVAYATRSTRQTAQAIKLLVVAGSHSPLHMFPHSIVLKASSRIGSGLT